MMQDALGWGGGFIFIRGFHLPVDAWLVSRTKAFFWVPVPVPVLAVWASLAFFRHGAESFEIFDITSGGIGQRWRFFLYYRFFLSLFLPLELSLSISISLSLYVSVLLPISLFGPLFFFP